MDLLCLIVYVRLCLVCGDVMLYEWYNRICNYFIFIFLIRVLVLVLVFSLFFIFYFFVNPRFIFWLFSFPGPASIHSFIFFLHHFHQWQFMRTTIQKKEKKISGIFPKIRMLNFLLFSRFSFHSKADHRIKWSNTPHCSGFFSDN